jgi:hypothetical protein
MVIPKKNHYISLILLAIFGAALAFATFVTIKDFEDEKIALNLREKSEDRIFTFQQLIDTSIEESVDVTRHLPGRRVYPITE